MFEEKQIPSTPSSHCPSLPDDPCATTPLINGINQGSFETSSWQNGVPAYSRSTPSTKRKAASFEAAVFGAVELPTPHHLPCEYLNTFSTSLCPHELHLKVTLDQAIDGNGQVFGGNLCRLPGITNGKAPYARPERVLQSGQVVYVQ